MSNTTKLPQSIFELVQTLLDVRSQMEDVCMESESHASQYGDARHIFAASDTIIGVIDETLDLIHYNGD